MLCFLFEELLLLQEIQRVLCLFVLQVSLVNFIHFLSFFIKSVLNGITDLIFAFDQHCFSLFVFLLQFYVVFAAFLLAFINSLLPIVLKFSVSVS